MGYEGYSQFWCKNGHHWTVDCNLLIWKDEKEKCPICGEEEVFENMVNVTNGSYDEETGERIDGFRKLKIKSETSGKCSACGKKHICDITYEIPKNNKDGEYDESEE